MKYKYILEFFELDKSETIEKINTFHPQWDVIQMESTSYLTCSDPRTHYMTSVLRREIVG